MRHKFMNFLRGLFKVNSPSKELDNMINLWNSKMGGK